MAKVAFFGSSYISRFDTHCTPRGMQVPEDVRFFGKGGMCASSVLCSNELNDIIEFQPHVTFVVLGGNDVKDSCVPHTILVTLRTL